MPCKAAQHRMHILGLIPARGGSKSILNKNIAPLTGKPLLTYTCEAARQSKRLTRIILSTDDSGVAEVARTNDIEVPFLRPAELATDTSGMMGVIIHALNFLQEKEQYVPDIVVLLQPTSPLRKASHIDAAVDLLISTGADSVVSVVEVPHQFTPGSIMKFESGRLTPYEQGQTILRRQDKPKLYGRNGPAVLAVQRSVLLEKQSLYGDDTRGLIMEVKESIDIDTSLDLEIAEFFLTR